MRGSSPHMYWYKAMCRAVSGEKFSQTENAGYSAWHGSAPRYISDIINVYHPVSRHALSSCPKGTDSVRLMTHSMKSRDTL
jgi:hypothetical protein